MPRMRLKPVQCLQLFNQTGKSIVVELDQHTAAPTHRVVVSVTRQVVRRNRLAGIDAHDETDVLEELEGAVDRRLVQVRMVHPDPFHHLIRREMLRLVGDEFDDHGTTRGRDPLTTRSESIKKIIDVCHRADRTVRHHIVRRSRAVGSS